MGRQEEERMKPIEEIDRNFALNQKTEDGLIYYDVWQPPFQAYGIVPNEKKNFCRFPLEVLPTLPEGVRSLSSHLAGACVRFSTDAASIAVKWRLPNGLHMPHCTPCAKSGLELFEESDQGIFAVKNLVPALNEGAACLTEQQTTVDLPQGMRHYALYLPLYNGLEYLHIGFPEGAQILPGRTPAIEKPLVFYGSTITQGGCAAKVGSCYTTILARRLDAAQINLGFSGNARGETAVAEYIASLSMSAFIYDYDHNAPSPEHLEKTHEPFFKIIRAAQPDLPIIMVSKPDFKGTDRDIRQREIIRKTYENARKNGDENVYFVDGETFFGTQDRDMCTVDGTHPTSLGFLRMADGLEPVLRQVLKL